MTIINAKYLQNNIITIGMKDRINNKRRGDDSYLAVNRCKRRGYIVIIAFPVAVASSNIRNSFFYTS